jgi:hypothetical protein
LFSERDRPCRREIVHALAEIGKNCHEIFMALIRGEAASEMNAPATTDILLGLGADPACFLASAFTIAI